MRQRRRRRRQTKRSTLGALLAKVPDVGTDADFARSNESGRQGESFNVETPAAG
jgi:hypothetical protein